MNQTARDIDLRLEVARPGRPGSAVSGIVVRPLQASDLALLAVNRGTQPVQLKRLTDRHHGLARLLAMGTAPSEAGLIMGYEPSRVSILQGDPAFEELIRFYRDKVDYAFEGRLDQISSLSRDVINELRDRIEGAPEEFTNRELKELLETTLDRSGLGKVSTQVHGYTDLGSKLEAARKRVLEERLAQARDVTP